MDFWISDVPQSMNCRIWSVLVNRFPNLWWKRFSFLFLPNFLSYCNNPHVQEPSLISINIEKFYINDFQWKPVWNLDLYIRQFYKVNTMNLITWSKSNWEYLETSAKCPFYTGHQSKATANDFLIEFSDAHFQFSLWRHQKEQNFVFSSKEEKRHRLKFLITQSVTLQEKR